MYVLDPFHLGQQVFESSSGSTAPPKRTSADIGNSESTQNLNIYPYNYQTETAIFLATKHEKTVLWHAVIYF